MKNWTRKDRALSVKCTTEKRLPVYSEDVHVEIREVIKLENALKKL